MCVCALVERGRSAAHPVPSSGGELVAGAGVPFAGGRQGAAPVMAPLMRATRSARALQVAAHIGHITA